MEGETPMRDLDALIRAAVPASTLASAPKPTSGSVTKPKTTSATKLVVGWAGIARENRVRLNRRRRELNSAVRVRQVDPVMAYLERLYEDEQRKPITPPNRVLAGRRCMLCDIPGARPETALCDRCGDRTMFDACGACGWAPFSQETDERGKRLRIARLRNADGSVSRICPVCGTEDWWTRKEVPGTKSRAELAAGADAAVLEDRGFDSATRELVESLARIRAQSDSKASAAGNHESLTDRAVFERVYREAFAARMSMEA